MNSLLSVLSDPAATAVVQKFFPRGTLLQNGDLDRIREHLELVESCSQLTASNLFRKQFVSLAFLGIEERLAELAPTWSFPPSLTLPRILHNFCMKKCVQIPAELLTLSLTILNDAYLHQRKTTATSWLSTELEQRIGDSVNDIVRILSHQLYKASKTIAAHVALPEPISIEIRQLNATLTLAGRSVNLYSAILQELARLCASFLASM